MGGYNDKMTHNFICMFGRHKASRDFKLKVLKQYLETGWNWDSDRCTRCGHMIGVFFDKEELTFDVLENLNGYNGLEIKL